jgi:hypothetical protein
MVAEMSMAAKRKAEMDTHTWKMKQGVGMQRGSENATMRVAIKDGQKDK